MEVRAAVCLRLDLCLVENEVEHGNPLGGRRQVDMETGKAPDGLTSEEKRGDECEDGTDAFRISLAAQGGVKNDRAYCDSAQDLADRRDAGLHLGEPIAFILDGGNRGGHALLHEILELKRFQHADTLRRLAGQRKDLRHAAGFTLGRLLCCGGQAAQNESGDGRGRQDDQKQYRLLADHDGTQAEHGQAGRGRAARS